MKKATGIIFIAVCLHVQLFAQLTAGAIAPGTGSWNPSVSLSVSTIGQSVLDSFDVDCDGSKDLKVELHKGATAIDGANYALLYIKNPAFEICADTSIYTKQVNYYTAGDTLNCSGYHQWAMESVYILSYFGCMDCMGPASVSNKYVAYRKTGGVPQTGWIRISFNLIDGGSSSAAITLSVSEIMALCPNASVEELAGAQMKVTAFPNPFSDNTMIEVHSDHPGQAYSFVLTDVLGKTVRSAYNITEKQFSISKDELKDGMYFYTVTGADGIAAKGKLVIK